MNLKSRLIYIISFVSIFVVFKAEPVLAQDSTKPWRQIKEWLPVPFGTIVKLKVEIVDGEELRDKVHQGDFLFRVKNIDSILLPQPIIIEFRDETGKFPNDEFKLYKYLYGKDTGMITGSRSDKMKKKYVGKEFTIAAYEAGEFSGHPRGYHDYQPLSQSMGFHFKHYVIVIADLIKTGD